MTSNITAMNITYPTQILAGSGVYVKVLDTTVAAPATSIDITGLDLVSAKFLLIEGFFKNNVGGGVAIRAYLNGDTTNANYSLSYLEGNGIAASSGTNADCFLLSNTVAGENANFRIVLQQASAADKAFLSSQTMERGGSIRLFRVNWNAAAAAVTRLTLTCSVADAWGTGSRLVVSKVA